MKNNRSNAPYFKSEEEAREYVRSQIGAISSKAHKTLETIERYGMTDYQTDTGEKFHSFDFQLRYFAKNALACYGYYHQRDLWEEIRHMFTPGLIPQNVLKDLLLSMREHHSASSS